MPSSVSTSNSVSKPAMRLKVLTKPSSHFKQRRRTHSATDTHAGHHVLYAAPLAFNQRVAHYA